MSLLLRQTLIGIGEATVTPPPPMVALPPLTATFHEGLAIQDSAGKQHPIWESVQADITGAALSFGDCGNHWQEMSNAVTRFTPTGRSSGYCDHVTIWEQYTNNGSHIPKVPPQEGLDGDGTGQPQPGVGWNKHSSTYDNFPVGYYLLPTGHFVIWHNIGAVVDVGVAGGANGTFIRGNHYPQTETSLTWADGGEAFFDNPFSAIYNPAYAQCRAKGWVCYLGVGGTGSVGGADDAYTLRIYKPNNSTTAPFYTMHSYVLDASIYTQFRRNNACCVDKFMYVGGGAAWGISSSGGELYLSDTDHGRVIGDQLKFFNPQYPLPPNEGLNVFYHYYIVTVGDAGHIQVSATPGGSPITGFADADVPTWASISVNTLFKIDLDPDDTGTSTPTFELISKRFANGGADLYPQLLPDEQNQRLIYIGQKVSVMDLATVTWSTVNVIGWPTGGYFAVGGIYNEEFSTPYFRGTPNDANGYPNYNLGVVSASTWHSIDFGPIRAQVGNSEYDFDLPGWKIRFTNPSFVDGILGLYWPSYGGNWKNKLGTDNDLSNPWHTWSLPDETLGSLKSLDVKLLTVELLNTENTGFYARRLTGGNASFGLWPNIPNIPGTTFPTPQLTITLFDATVVVLDATVVSEMSIESAGYARDSFLVKFDLTGINAANVNTSVLTMYRTGPDGYSSADWGIYKLYPPLIRDIPSEIRAETPNDAAPGDILVRYTPTYANTIVAEAIAAGWRGLGGELTQIQAWDGHGPGWSSGSGDTPPYANGGAFRPDGAGRLECTARIGTNTASSSRWFFDLIPELSGVDLSHMFMTWTDKSDHRITLPPDLDVNPVETRQGVKFPGLVADENAGFSFRLEQTAASQWNPQHKGRFSYSYFASQHDGLAGDYNSGTGNPIYFGQEDFYLERIARTNWWTQEVKSNTFIAGVPQHDGIYRVWHNWVMMYERTDLVLFTIEGQTDIIAFMLQLYYGGNGPTSLPSNEFGVTFGDFTLSKKFPGRQHFLRARGNG